jgi:hypothetical protein
MNHKDANLADADQARFERLADGELNDTERRALLAGLDDVPDGWRRCALAFLEAQCLRETFAPRDGRDESESARAAGPIAAVKPKSVSPWLGRAGTIMAMAASFLVAMWLGTLMLGERQGQVGLPGGNEAMQIAADKPAAPWRLVSVAAATADGRPGPAINLPAVERDKIDQQWLDAMPRPMPEAVVKAFERTGHEVRQWRDLMPVRLDDGRQLVLPVDQVEVRYVGGEAY